MYQKPLGFLILGAMKKNNNKNHNKMKRLNCLLLALIFTIGVNAQTIKKYSGQMSKPEWIAELLELGSYDINGYYSYYEDERENRIIHGEFFISYKTSFVDGIDRYEIQGSFSHGKRDGKWVMKAKLFNGRYSDKYLYKFEYSDGMLNGPFYFHAPAIQDVEIVGHFVNGLIADKVIIKQQCFLGNCFTQVEGFVNKNGNPHGIWAEKDVSEKAIPKEITRLYYDGNLVYRREKDLSSGNIVYTYSVFDEIRTPDDIGMIYDIIINGKECVKVGKKICLKDKTSDSYRTEERFVDDRESNDGCVLYGVIVKNCPMMDKIYPSIRNWRTKFDSEKYQALVRWEQAEKQRRKEEQLREERRLKEEAERRQREEELRKKKEEEARLNTEIKTAYEKDHGYFEFCWGRFESSSKFEKLYREIGLDSINAILDSISRYEYENFTVEELFTNNPDYRYYVYNVLLSDLGRKKKKKLNKVFKTYEAYIQCKKGGVISLEKELR